jgi:hypothetical protein
MNKQVRFILIAFVVALIISEVVCDVAKKDGAKANNGIKKVTKKIKIAKQKIEKNLDAIFGSLGFSTGSESAQLADTVDAEGNVIKEADGDLGENANSEDILIEKGLANKKKVTGKAKGKVTGKTKVTGKAKTKVTGKAKAKNTGTGKAKKVTGKNKGKNTGTGKAKKATRKNNGKKVKGRKEPLAKDLAEILGMFGSALFGDAKEKTTNKAGKATGKNKAKNLGKNKAKKVGNNKAKKLGNNKAKKLGNNKAKKQVNNKAKVVKNKGKNAKNTGKKPLQ